MFEVSLLTVDQLKSCNFWVKWVRCNHCRRHLRVVVSRLVFFCLARWELEARGEGGQLGVYLGCGFNVIEDAWALRGCRGSRSS